MKMRSRFSAVLLMAGAAAAHGAAGEVIRSFAVGNVRGLAYDYGDDTLWAVTVSANNCMAHKYNVTTGSLLGPGVSLSGMYWNYEIGYGYLVNGTRMFVALDSANPYVRLYTQTGSYYGSLLSPFSGGYTQGCDCDWNGVNVYLGNYSYTNLYRWSGTAWTNFGTLPQSSSYGIAVAYDNVWVYCGSPASCIYRLNSAGSLMGSLVFSSTAYIAGMARGRVDCYNGNEDSIFAAVYYPSNMIYEISVGNVASGAAVAPRSFGQVKALYK